MPATSDIILVTELPEFEMAEGFLQFTLTSGNRTRTFRITRHKARASIHLATRVLDEADREPSNVEAFGGRRRPRGHV